MEEEFFKFKISNFIGNGKLPNLKKEKNYSKFAFVTSYISDDINENFIKQIIITGYQLKNFNIYINRILIIPNNVTIPLKYEKILYNLYSKIYFFPFIKWKCKGPEINFNDKIFYFKINIWLLKFYQKILFLGGFHLFLKNPSDIFNYPTPSSPPDFQSWIYSKNGPIQNIDFLIISPSKEIFYKILNEGCNYTSKPFLPNNLKNISFGPYDNGLITLFFQSNISTLPWWWNYEIPGHYIDILQNISRIFDEKIISLRFSKLYLPFNYKKLYFSQLWIEMFNNALNNNEMKIQNFKKNSKINLEKFVLNFYPEFQQQNLLYLIFRSLIIILISFFILLYSLTLKK